MLMICIQCTKHKRRYTSNIRKCKYMHTHSDYITASVGNKQDNRMKDGLAL